MRVTCVVVSVSQVCCEITCYYKARYFVKCFTIIKGVARPEIERQCGLRLGHEKERKLTGMERLG
jgi:hypothetical protein